MPQKILIIEDDKFVRELIFQKLQQENFEVFSAVDGNEGLQKIKQEKPDLILLDLILPDMEGFDVLSRMKKDTDIGQIPVIILSNLGEKKDVDRGVELGATDYLIKAHFTPSEIIGKIRAILK